MTCRTKPLQSANRPEDRRGGIKLIRHRRFSFEQAAEFAGEPVTKIHHWIKTRKLNRYYPLGGGDRRPRVDEVELKNLLACKGAEDGA